MRFRLIVLVAAALLVVAPGCGGSSSSKGTTSTAATAEPDTETAGAEEAGSSETFDRDNYALLVSDPDAHKGADSTIVGRIFNEVEQDADGTYFQMWANPKDSEWNTIVGVADPTLRLSDGDYVRVVGTVTGEFSLATNASPGAPAWNARCFAHSPLTAERSLVATGFRFGQFAVDLDEREAFGERPGEQRRARLP